MQGWSLERKIQVTQTRILEWYQKWDGKVYVSFSGGKDSTVLADLAARVCKSSGFSLTLWFSDTGLEYPEIRKHVKYFPQYIKEKYDIEADLVMDYPKDRNGNRITFKDVINKYGYPLISKQVSNTICYAKPGNTRWSMMNGDLIDKNTNKPSTHFNYSKWNYVLGADFKVSDQCCTVMKKRPAYKFEKITGMKPILGLMADESKKRAMDYMKTGCNAFDKKHPQSQPIGFWTEQDVLRYLKSFKIPYASVYGDILQDQNGKLYTTGYSRTGCMFCGFGCHLEKYPNRFQRLKVTHPKVWEYCMKPISDGGLGMREVLEFIGVDVD